MRKYAPIKPGILMFAIILFAVQSGCRKADVTLDPAGKEVQNPDAKTSKPQKGKTSVIQSWYNLSLKLIKETPGHTPPIAARTLGYMGITLYESVLPGHSSQSHSLAGQLNGLNTLPQRNGGQYDEVIIVNAALAKIIKSLFGNASPANKTRIDSLQMAIQQQYSANLSNATLSRSADFGNAVANEIYNWSLTDGGNQAYLNIFPSDYTAPAGAGMWVPTAPAYQPAMLPYWGSNRTFVPTNGPGTIDPPAPLAFSESTNSAFYNEARIVYNTVNNLTNSQSEIASYWADGGNTFTPPGHNISIVLQAIRNNNMNLFEASALLAKAGIGLNDAGIICWRSKFNNNLLRPITYINRYVDPAWASFLPTPPFPAYASGHASFSGTVSQLLTNTLGNTSFTDSSKMVYGFAPRTFRNYNAAADEAAISRLYGGIHYRFDNNSGLECGRLIAANVERLRW